MAYSLGIKLDLANLTFSETGGIYVKSTPSEAKIYLDGKPVKNTTSFFQAGTIIDNLKEGEYHLALQENGYFNWQKNVKVLPSLVNVFDNIVMIPEKEAVKIAEPADKIELLENILITEQSGGVYVNGVKIPGNNIIDTDLNDSLVTYNNVTKDYYLVNLSNPNSYLNISNIFTRLKETKLGLPGAVPLLKVSFHPFNKDKVIVRSRGALYNIDTVRSTIEKIADNVIDFKTEGSNLLFYTVSGLYRYNLIFRNAVELISLNEDKTIKTFSSTGSGELVILYSDGELSLITSDAPLKIADKVKLFSVSDNEKLIAFGDSDESLHIYDAEKSKYADIKNGVTGSLNKIVWYKDNSHLLLQNDNSLYFSEISEIMPVNCFKIAVDVRDFSYDEDKNIVYINSAGGVLEYKI